MAHVEREIALVKVAGTGDKRIEALRMADVFRAKVVDTTLTSFIFEITGSSDKVDRFIALMRECGLVEVGRSEEHTSELQSLMRISYAVFCLKKKKTTKQHTQNTNKQTHTNKQ